MSKERPRNGFLIMGTGLLTGISFLAFINFVCQDVRGLYFDFFCFEGIHWLILIPAIIFIIGFVIQVKNSQPPDASA